MTITSAHRARAVLTTSFDVQPGVSDAGVAPRLRVTSRYAIFASGRVAVTSTVRNDDAQSVPVGYFEFAHVKVAALGGWDSADGADGGITDPTQPYFFLRRVDARANLLQIRLGSLTDHDERNSATDRYFAVNPKPSSVAQGTNVTRDWELRVWPDGLSGPDLVARANDVRSAGVESFTGATNVAYDSTEGAYVATGATGLVTVRLTSGDRFDPSFVIRGWPGTKFRVLRNGALLASDGVPATTRATAAFDAANANKELVVSTYETLAASSSAAERTFTFEP